MTNAEFIASVVKKNRANFKLVLENKRFVQDVKRIRDVWGLPIPLTHIEDLEVRVLVANQIFLWHNLPKRAILLLKRIYDKPFPHIDDAKIVKAFTMLRELSNEREKANITTESFHDMGIRRPDSSDPRLFRDLSLRILSSCLSHSGGAETVGSLSHSLIKSLGLTSDEYMFFNVTCAKVMLLNAEFIEHIWSLLDKLKESKFGKEWFPYLIMYILSNVNPVDSGFVPPLDLLILQLPDGKINYESTLSTTIRDSNAFHSLVGRPRKHNYPHKKQERDLEILELSKRKEQDKEELNRREGNTRERSFKRLFGDDKEIASKILGLDSRVLDTSISKKDLRRMTKRGENLIRQAKLRIEKEIDQSYDPA